MGVNPLETKIEAPKAADVLAAAAGVPTPAQVSGLWGKVWRHRKLAIILGGSGIALGGGAYGYKHFTATPGTVNADTPAVVSAKLEEPPFLPPSVKDESPFTMPAVVPVKGEGPAPGIAMPTSKLGPEGERRATPATKPDDTDLPPIEFPAIAVDKTKTVKTNDGPTLVLPPNPGIDQKLDRANEPPLPDIDTSGKKKVPVDPASCSDPRVSCVADRSYREHI